MIDCKAIASRIKEELKPLVTKDKQLAIIQVGEDPESNIYVKNKGINLFTFYLKCK